jgi:uncharacterized protein YhhL (DUF1145 family)
MIPEMKTMAIRLNKILLEISTLYAWAKKIITSPTKPQPQTWSNQYRVLFFGIITKLTTPFLS